MWKKLLTIYLIFGLSFAILVALSLYAFQRFNAYAAYDDAVERHHTILNHLQELRFGLAQLENHQRAVLSFADSSFQPLFSQQLESIRINFRDLYQILEYDSSQKRNLQKLNFEIRRCYDYLQTGIVAGYPPGDFKQEKAALEACLQIIRRLENAESDKMSLLISRRQFFEETTPQNFRLLFVVTLGVFAISFGFMVQQYRHRIKYQRALERKILELNQANSEWEQIAYVASHDLQEPVRKIRTFSDLLKSRHRAELGSEGATIVDRIENASERVQYLMTDIVNYNMVVYTREQALDIDLNDVVDNVVDHMRQNFMRNGASIQHDDLPKLRAFPSQMDLLFRSLIENSLKFSRPEVAPRIFITSCIVGRREVASDLGNTVAQYHKILYEDNGIGFENQFSEKIFKMFQRLHGQDSSYEGRGIGLAIAKRIVTNHMGVIVARGRPGKGSKFTLYFPVP